MNRFIFVLLCVTTFSVSIFGQTLEEDLKKSFRKFKIIKINNQEALRKARLKLPFKIQPEDKEFQFILRQNDIRTPDYKAEYTDREGRHRLPRAEVFTYKARIIGERNSVVALTVDGTKLEGYFATENEGYYIESARKYSSRAGDDDKVIFKEKDKVKQDDGVCGLDEMVSAEMQKINPVANMESNPSSPRRVIEMATEADKDFVTIQAGGNPANANAIILGLLNQVDAVFETQLNLSIVVTYQHAWTPGTDDPYDTFDDTNTDPSDDYIVLESLFRNYWNANFPKADPDYRRDAAHLFTRKVTSVYIGYAPGWVCSNGDVYGFSSEFSTGWRIVAHEIGHQLFAQHTNSQSGCTGTLMQAAIPPIATQFCPFSVNEMTNHVNTLGSCLHIESNPSSQSEFDFDEDGEADISVFRSSDTYWYIERSTEGFIAVQFGVSTDKLAPADYDGDGKTDVAVFRPSNGTWYLLQSSNSAFVSQSLGTSGDIPQPADFTGDGRAELALFRPSNGEWHTFDLSNNQSGFVQHGTTGDKPVVGNYDGDLRADYAVFRPSDSTWYINQSTLGSTAIQFGLSTDMPVPADYTGDGKTDLTVYRDGMWYRRLSSQTFDTQYFGLSTDIPTPADYDGDGRADISIFRNGLWGRINSSSNQEIYINFGQSGDAAVPAFKIVQ